MNRFALILFLSCLSTALCAQDQAPTLPHEAAHCLIAADQHWLDPQTLQAPELDLAFQLDTKTLLGDEYLYLIVYTTPARNQGKIFDIRIKQKHDYSIENSATFVSSAKGVELSPASRRRPMGADPIRNRHPADHRAPQMVHRFDEKPAETPSRPVRVRSWTRITHPGSFIFWA